MSNLILIKSINDEFANEKKKLVDEHSEYANDLEKKLSDSQNQLE